MKKRNRILSAICAMTMVSSLLTVPAALADETADLGLGELITDECTSKTYLTSPISWEATVNTTYGFIWNSDTTGWADHYTQFNYGMKGNWEVTFDYFLDDYDKTLSKDSEGNEKVITKDPNLMITDSSGKTRFDKGSGFANLSWGKDGKMRTWLKDDDTPLAIQQYARATRKYGTLEDGDTNPTHLNVKVAIQDSKLSVMAKWNTEKTWRNCNSVSTLNSSYSVDTPIAIQLVSCYAGIDNIKVMTQIYDKSLLPGINPAGMAKRTINPSTDIVAVKDSYSEIKDVATKNFVLSFKAKSNTNVFRHDVWFGTKQGVVPSALDGTTYTGRTNYLGKLWEDVSWLTGYFEGDSGLNEPTVREHGIQRQKFGVANWWKANETYDVCIAFMDNVMIHGMKKADENTYTWYRLPYSRTAKVGGIMLCRAGGEVITYSDMTLWTDAPQVTFDKENVTAGDTITASAVNYNVNDSQIKLINAIYKKTADGSWRLNSVDMSEDNTSTDGRTLTAAVTVPNDGETYKVKAMLWSVGTMKPYCNAVELTTAAE